jgi:hypothetical protein
MIVFFVFNTVIVGCNVSLIINLTVTNKVFHYFIHASLRLVSLNKWVPVIGFTDKI